MSILEFADHGLNGLAKSGILAVGPINAPLMGLRVIYPQGQALDMTCRAIGLEFLQISPTVPNFSRHRSAVEFDPGFGANQAILEARQMNFSGANLEIEIVLSVPVRFIFPGHRSNRRHRAVGLGRGCLSEGRVTLEDQAQDADCATNPNGLASIHYFLLEVLSVSLVMSRTLTGIVVYRNSHFTVIRYDHSGISRFNEPCSRHIPSTNRARRPQ